LWISSLAQFFEYITATKCSKWTKHYAIKKSARSATEARAARAMNTNRALLQKTVAFILSVIFWLFVYRIGHAQTSLSPTRIVFSQANAADPTLKQVVVTNTSAEPITYKLSLIEMRMNDEGKLESSIVPAAGQLSQ
jgi:hypothetical protein